MALSTSTNGSINGQANAQSPQTSAPAGAGSPVAAPASKVQPGTTNGLLSGPGGGSTGIPLNSTILPVSNLDTVAHTVSQSAQPESKPAQHHLNGVLMVIVAALVVLALIAFLLTARSAKNTTTY